MAIFDARIPSATADVVRINAAGSLRQLFTGARPIKATIAEGAKLMTHPLENGEVVTDHRVILPVAISISVILRSAQYRDTYAAIRQAFRRSDRFTVQTKTDTYHNMYLRDIPHQEDPDKFNTISMILEFVEAQFFNVQVQDFTETEVIEREDSSTINRGEQSNQDGGSIALDLFRRFARAS